MAGIDRGNAYTVLSSDWTGLSPSLIATFYPVERVARQDERGFDWKRSANSIEVRAPISDASAEISQNWNSPFENTGADQKFSAFSAMLQSGGFAGIADAVSKNAWLKEYVPFLAGGADWVKKRSNSLEGSSGVTKLNSMQIFNGSPPIKLSMTVHFRAIKDAADEVERPIDQLIQWTLPQYLDGRGFIERAADADVSLFPSKTPQIVAMEYAGNLFSPMVIEHLPYPLSAPRDKAGRMLSASMQITIASLTAIDKADWVNIRAGK